MTKGKTEAGADTVAVILMPTSFHNCRFALFTFSCFPVIMKVIVPATPILETWILSTFVDFVTLSTISLKSLALGLCNWSLVNRRFSVTIFDCRFFAPTKGRRGVGAGVDARDELADFPLTPLVAGEAGFLAPHEPAGF